MFKKAATFIITSLIFISQALAQKSIDLTLMYPPGSGNFRNYSIYEPVGFKPGKANKLMVGFHPYGLGTWNAATWRDTLRSFIDLVNVLLVCPDGGSNGRIDDQEDYDFTEALIEEIKKQYTIDPMKIFAIGFSVGGKAVYEYGLVHDKEIKGMIPIGAAIDGVDFSSIIHKAKCNSFYLIHGEKDSPNTRYAPMKTDLLIHDGLVDGILMANIGHTINFPSRNTILKMAFTFVDTSECDITGITENEISPFQIAPSFATVGEKIKISFNNKSPEKMEIYHISGKKVMEYNLENNYQEDILLNTNSWPQGLNFITVYWGNSKFTGKIYLN